MKPSRIILLVAAAIFLVALGVNFASNTSSYADFVTAKESGKRVHIAGEWVNRDQASYDPEADLFKFYVQDSLNNIELVHFFDPKPNNFDQAEKVVLIGGYDKLSSGNMAFVADKIITKCPSKYEETEVKLEQTAL
ncbi:MAG: cytochrome c maturation protein CcmE [Bacteroidota bacterium]